MKVYIVCFDGDHISHPTAFLDLEKAEERLRIMQDEMDAATQHYTGRADSWIEC